MKKSYILLLAALAGLTQLATAAAYKVFPSYSLEARDTEDAFHPMVGLEEGLPLIVKDNAVLRSEKRYVRVRERSSINNLSIEVLSREEQWNENNLVLNAWVKSSQPIGNAFAVLIYTQEGKDVLACKYSEIPELTGEPQQLKMRFNNTNVPKAGWTLHFFQAGLELYDPNSTALSEPKPDQAFALAMARHISAAGAGNANPAPFYSPVPDLAPGLLPEGDDPFTVKIKMKVLINGKVGEVSFPDPVSPELEGFLKTMLEDWRLLPRIKEGARIDQTVVLPVRLR